MVLSRYQHAGAAPGTTLNGSINASVTTFTATNGTGYPDGSVGPFVVKLDAGTGSEEKILCLSRSGNTFNVVTSPSSGRGYDGTSASGHSNGATVEHDWSAAEADDASRHIYGNASVLSDDHTNYPLLTGSRAFTGTVTTSGALSAALSGTAGRYVGQTNGSPTGGPYNTGDFADDPTNVAFWINTSGGSPGTWVSFGGGFVGGSMYATNAGTTVNSSSNVTIATTQDWVAGGVTVGSNALVVPQTGYYLLQLQATWTSIANAGEFDADIIKNASTGILAHRTYGTTLGEFANATSKVIALSANDSLTLLASNQSAGSAHVLGSDTIQTWLSALKVAP